MNSLLVDSNLAYQPPDFEGLVRWLRRQARRADEDSRAQAALAQLRRGLRDDPRDRLIVGKYVVPFLGTEPRKGQDRQRWQEDCCFLVAALFASHPVDKPGVSLGAALGEIQADSGSIESRFLNLLTMRSERLRMPLRQIIALLSTNKRQVPLDWLLLLNDLGRWNDRDMRVQQRWARAFYRAAPDSDTSYGDSHDEN